MKKKAVFALIFALLMTFVFNLYTFAENEVEKAYESVIAEVLQSSGGERDFMLPTYSLYDMNGDDVPELFVKLGTCEADYRYSVYTCRDGNAVILGEIPGSHCYLCSYENGKGVMRAAGHMGYECFELYSLENNKLECKTLLQKEMPGDYDEPEDICPGAYAIEYGADYEYYYVNDLSQLHEFFKEQPKNIRLFVNGDEVEFDQPPVTQNDRTLVPVRAVFEALGAAVSWNEETSTVSAVKGDIEIMLTVDSKKMYINTKIIKNLDVAATVINGRTLVPVRAISEAFGAKVDWNEENRTIYVIYNDSLYNETLAKINEELKTDKVNGEYFSVTLPDSWGEVCEYRETNYSDIYRIEFFEKLSRKAHTAELGFEAGGNLFDICLIPDDGTEIEYPSFMNMGVLKGNNTSCRVVATFPTDVQFTTENRTLYETMQADIDGILKTLTPNDGWNYEPIVK